MELATGAGTCAFIVQKQFLNFECTPRSVSSAGNGILTAVQGNLIQSCRECASSSKTSSETQTSLLNTLGFLQKPVTISCLSELRRHSLAPAPCSLTETRAESVNEILSGEIGARCCNATFVMAQGLLRLQPTHFKMYQSDALVALESCSCLGGEDYGVEVPCWPDVRMLSRDAAHGAADCSWSHKTMHRSSLVRLMAAHGSASSCDVILMLTHPDATKSAELGWLFIVVRCLVSSAAAR